MPRAGGPPRSLLPILLLSTLLAKLAFEWRFEGFLTGDDLEIVQSAAKYAAGVKYQIWDIRCLFHPLVLVWPVMKLAVLLGAAEPRLLCTAAALPTVLFSTAGILLVFHLSRRFGAGERTALAAAFLYALHPLQLAYGATPFPRPISAALLAAAFLLATREEVSFGGLTGAGLLTGAAFAVRWSEGVVLLPLVAWSAWRSKTLKTAGAIALGFAAGAFLFAGVMDRLTWGGFFASLKAYFQTMYFEASPIHMAQEDPFPEYFRTALHWAGPLLVLLLLAARKDRRARTPLLLGLSVVVLMSFFVHKEWRYLQSAIPFLSIAAAFGWERLRKGGHGVLAVAALLLAVPYGLERSWTLLSEKSGSGLEAARYIRSLRPPPHVLAFAQTWAWGEHLYLGNEVEIREIEWHRPPRPRAIREQASGADIVGVYTKHLDRAGMEELAALGFRRLRTFKRDAAYECAVYGRGIFARASSAPGTSTLETRGPEADPTRRAASARHSRGTK